MDLTKVIDEAKQKTGLNQDQLAARIGLNRTALSHVLHGRRKLPAEAAIELFDLTGIHPRDIMNATVKPKSTSMHAACIALAAVTLFVTLPPNTAYASSPYDGRISHNTYSHAFRRRLLATIEQLSRALGRWRMLRTA